MERTLRTAHIVVGAMMIGAFLVTGLFALFGGVLLLAAARLRREWRTR